MYKQIYEKIKLLLIQPRKFWEEEANKSKEDIAGNFVYPLLGFVALAAFIGYWWDTDTFHLPRALQVTCVSFVAGFAGYFIAAFLIDELSPGLFHLKKNILKARIFVGYASVIFYLVTIFMNLLPSFFFVFLFLFYTVYIIWEGSDVFMKVKEKDRQKFTLGASVVIVGAPLLIEKVLLALLPSVNM
ncbi:MAG: YIP1 family protein [Candidatus Azobacteroides sp.]|nr:YIP1 family protein [Candidatus Azobacteroides sp.]